MKKKIYWTKNLKQYPTIQGTKFYAQNTGYYVFEDELSIHLVCLNNSYYWNHSANPIIVYYPNAHVALCFMGVCCNSPLPGKKGVSYDEVF